MPKSKSRSNGPSTGQITNLLRGTKSAGVPPFMMVEMLYPIAFTSSSTTGNNWYWQFRINSLFDPDFTGTGQQPHTFDQWMALYDRYRVFACELDFVVMSLDGLAPLTAAISPGVDAAPTLTFAAIAGRRDADLGQAPYMAMRRFKKRFLIKDVFGIDEEALCSEINYSGTSSSSAPAVAYANIGVFTSGATTPVFLTGMMKFAVRLESPHDGDPSLRARIAGPSPTPSTLPSCIPCTHATTTVGGKTAVCSCVVLHR